MGKQEALDELKEAAVYLDKALAAARGLPRGIISMIRLEQWRIDNLIRWVERVSETAVKTLYAETEEERKFSFIFNEGLPTETKISVFAINKFEASIKAREKFTEQHGIYHKTVRML